MIMALPSPETHASPASYWRRAAQSLGRTRQDLAMTFKPAIWRPISIGLSVINLVAAAFAAGSSEPLHAGVHVALGLAFGYWAQRLGQAPGDLGLGLGPELQPRLEALEFEVSDLRRELSETQERLDFTERVLAQGQESRRLDQER
jgi:hypothetical protein